ncbi:MAG TPA: hypothetical protein VNQ73_05340 [Ilumatobacter sp.]|nr:hypothetical protein [Ilumatobacter sp.]
MPFQEKSAIVMTAILIVVYGAYFALLGLLLGRLPADEIPYQPLLIVAVVPLAVLAAFSHIILALLNPKEANANDERDRLITLRAERIGGYILAVGVFTGITLAMVEVAWLYIANALMLAWVLAEVTEGTTKVVLYRRGT